MVRTRNEENVARTRSCCSVICPNPKGVKFKPSSASNKSVKFPQFPCLDQQYVFTSYRDSTVENNEFLERKKMSYCLLDIETRFSMKHINHSFNRRT